MNTLKQFWALFKFQSSLNPYMLAMPVVFGVPFFLPLFQSTITGYHPSFTTLLFNQNLFFIGIFGASILAPEKYQFANPNLTTVYYGNEFVLTRAIDRPVFYRAKVALLYSFILVVPLLALLHSMETPDLIVSEYSKPIRTQTLAHLPGSTLLEPKSKNREATEIAIPRGNVVVAEWQILIFLTTTLLLQLMLLLLYPFRHGKFLFWTLFFALIMVPLFDVFNWRSDVPTMYERAFFQFGAHQAWVWLVTACLFVPVQLWCERRFTRLEQ